jgi:hypothetical protein
VVHLLAYICPINEQQHAMNATAQFTAALRKYGKHTIGSTAVHASGVEYHHEHIAFRDAPYFMERLWQAASFEIHGNYAYQSELTINGTIYRHTRNPFKSGPRHRFYGCSILVKHITSQAA